jgi:hypothetical protein
MTRRLNGEESWATSRTQPQRNSTTKELPGRRIGQGAKRSAALAGLEEQVEKNQKRTEKKEKCTIAVPALGNGAQRSDHLGRNNF